MVNKRDSSSQRFFFIYFFTRLNVINKWNSNSEILNNSKSAVTWWIIHFNSDISNSPILLFSSPKFITLLPSHVHRLKANILLLLIYLFCRHRPLRPPTGLWVIICPTPAGGSVGSCSPSLGSAPVSEVLLALWATELNNEQWLVGGLGLGLRKNNRNKN